MYYVSKRYRDYHCSQKWCTLNLSALPKVESSLLQIDPALC